MNVIPKTYPTTLLPNRRRALPGTAAPLGIEQRLAALPEYERAIVEAMVKVLDRELEGVGRQTALELVWAAGRWARGIGRITR